MPRNDVDADRRETEAALARLRSRDSVDLEDIDEEDSAVIAAAVAAGARAAQASRPDSTPAVAKGIVAVLTVLTPWARLPALLAAIIGAALAGHKLGWW